MKALIVFLKLYFSMDCNIIKALKLELISVCQKAFLVIFASTFYVWYIIGKKLE